jgi:hypothetical protein
MAEIGYGITLYVSDAAPDTTADNVIAGVMTVTPPSPTRDIIDVSSFGQPGHGARVHRGHDRLQARSRRKCCGCPARRRRSAAHDLAGTRAAHLQDHLVAARPRREHHVPKAFLTAFERTSPLDDKMTATITLKVTGAPSYS